MTTPFDEHGTAAAGAEPDATPEQDAFVRSVLASLPAEQMPDAVWTRLESALLAEPPSAGTTTPDAAGVTASPTDATVLPMRRGVHRAGSSARGRRALTAVVGIAAGITALAVGVQVIGSRPTADSTAASAASTGPELSMAQVPIPVLASGTGYQLTTLEQQVGDLVGQSGKGAAPLAPGTDGATSTDGGSTSAGGASEAPGPPVGRSMPTPLRSPDAAVPIPTPPADSTAMRLAPQEVTSGSFAQTPQSLASCLTALPGIGADTATVVVDLASYAGRPVGVVVRRVGTSVTADVWVVGRGCSATDPQVVVVRRITLH